MGTAIPPLQPYPHSLRHRASRAAAEDTGGVARAPEVQSEHASLPHPTPPPGAEARRKKQDERQQLGDSVLAHAVAATHPGPCRPEQTDGLAASHDENYRTPRFCAVRLIFFLSFFFFFFEQHSFLCLFLLVF